MPRSIPIGFYVYQLVDPRTDAPFYVGKGQNGRAWQHERCVRSGNASGCARKNAKIAEIVEAGLNVDVKIVGVFDDEADALDLEYRLVEQNPVLTNVASGGAGTGRADSPLRAERRRKIYEEKRRRIVERRRQRHKEVEAEKATYRALALRGVRGADKHRAEIDAWLSSSCGNKAVASLQKPSRLSNRASKQALAAFRASKPQG